ncbi:spermidine/putrescine ABC transporter ATP-binding protein [Aestuariivirga litoralis]|uniref:Spermidine/putrescine ABC transporter ATP-binding protein n=1 Tax=Aestuariivirga litoralis TaxID=2650924 RepID=A0A2W2AKR1_9HYPH|nr:ABC transporter ATP-binding protein [Aestuariivirga litoralis]PZF76115.1 spermidine/putrescine ABC transporter ATP-binding protein [Aestuariivirga litoralis]
MNAPPNVIEFRKVTKRFGDVAAVADNDLAVKAGEFLSILGPSGCGKTTSLRMMAGFEQPTEGEVFIRGENVTGVPAYRRPVNMVFQHYALFPHLSVADNVSYGLRQRNPKPSKAQIDRAVDEALAMVRLSGYGKRRSYELSGGQQQRVALARALINRPAVLLLDEPLAALDRKLRRDMQIELQNLQRDVGITFLLVTHDQEEALSMSDRVCVMREGRIVQTGSPRELYDQPVNRYVADFVGKTNFFAGPSQAEVLSVRPEQIEIAASLTHLPEGLAARLPVKVLNRIFLGEHTEYVVASEQLGAFMVMAPRKSERDAGIYDIGDMIAAGWRAEAERILPNN